MSKFHCPSTFIAKKQRIKKYFCFCMTHDLQLKSIKVESTQNKEEKLEWSCSSEWFILLTQVYSDYVVLGSTKYYCGTSDACSKPFAVMRKWLG